MTAAARRSGSGAGTGLVGLEPRGGVDEPAWLADVRRDALGWVADHGLPTQRDEDWKYTRLKPLETVPFEPASPSTDPQPGAAEIDALSAGTDGPRLVFVNGHFAPALSRLGDLPSGVAVTNLGTALLEEVELLRPVVTDPEATGLHAFRALNTALAEDGVFIRLHPGTVVTEPIELLFYSGSGVVPVVASPRSIVIAERDSQATIIETHAGSGGVSCTNTVTELVVGPGARVELIRVQHEPETSYHFGLLDVRQQAGSYFRLSSVTLGSATSRVEVRVRLLGQHAAADLNGLYLCHGDQQHDNPVLVEHVAPNCSSRQLYKGVVDDRGHGVFNGHIIVRHGAFGTDASQTNRNLLMSDHAEVDTRPRLEILADDVKCSHGAAVGRLDGASLFYLQSRGIPAAEARTMLTAAFASEVTEHISVAQVRLAVGHRIDRWLSESPRTERVG